ncbi:class II fumarate hydratase [Desulfoferrobacter suflitae]|uniref:class II fumarate hydratase n=1 Tax=Desulfoferrobacter suflitae TaxID=2865782 RepID=UPI0021643523|nr:class II fumarate hydratase [Desulfoferrobacter suflitae]MCK8600874.1 class II fumarate hydratase [Desulfoferrobacter suflitae]
MKMRQEQDSFGLVSVPESAYYGAQTQRAAENFPVSGLRFPSPFIMALGLIKKCAAKANLQLELLDRMRAEAICQAAQEVVEGKLDDQFIVDVFQTGSGTSTNMNANEVIAGRANEIVTGRRGGRSPVHPNDHVNLGQSSNDVIPSAIHIAALLETQDRLIPALNRLRQDLHEKSLEFSDIIKIGRTHLQDAVPITLGQEFSGYCRQVTLATDRLQSTKQRLAELALGGTAVGTGLNAHPQFAATTIDLINAETRCSFREAVNHFEAQAAQDASVEISGALKTAAVSLSKIANDIRWLASGPRCGLGEINLPSLQPGSSIMPGKVNPVIPEAAMQVAAQIIGNDAVITLAGQGGYFELNLMLPVIAHNLLQSIRLLTSAAALLSGKCITGITANREKCAANVEQSLALATFLVPIIGYDKAAEVAKEAHAKNKTIRQVVLEQHFMSEQEFDKLITELHSS